MTIGFSRILSRFRLVVPAFLGLLLAGCAASGPPFQLAASIPPEKAIIYVYRPSVMHGAVYSPNVKVGDRVPVALKIGGYFTTVVPPGDVLVSINNVGTRSLTINALAGASYYVKGGTILMAGGYPALSLMPEETALPEIKECKLIEGGK